MARQSLTRARRRALIRRRRARRWIIVAILILAVAALALALTAALRGRRQDVAAQSAPTPLPTAEAPAPQPTEAPSETPSEAPSPEPTPTETPEPTATPAPPTEGVPDVVSFYTPQGKNYSPRVRMGETYTGPWKKGKDIGSFEVIASDEELLDGSFFGDIFGKAWTAFPASDLCKIGYTLRYALDDGGEVRFTMLSPAHIEHTEYIECWLYDDYHRKPHVPYSHLKASSMRDGVLITSIKLTAGPQIAHVTDIWLSAFVCTSLADFDADRNYIGDTSCTIHILKK